MCETKAQTRAFAPRGERPEGLFYAGSGRAPDSSEASHDDGGIDLRMFVACKWQRGARTSHDDRGIDLQMFAACK
jgi:hypothetical protein